MSSKIHITIIGILLFSFFNSFSESNDSILVSIATNKHQVDLNFEINKSTLPFFDYQDTILYLCFKHNESIITAKSFYTIEIKKRVLNQSKIRPFLSKKIELKALQNGLFCDSIAISEGILASGNYDVIVSLMNDSNVIKSQSKISFQVLRKSNHIQPSSPIEKQNFQSEEIDLSKTFVEKYTLGELRKNIAALEPLAEGGEIKVIKEIEFAEDKKALKQFFYYFWKSRNTENPESEWKNYASKLNEVAKKFGTSNQAGYKTDRGRVYLAYGPPDDEIKVVNEKDARPYEIWTYYELAGVTNERFLFYQPGLLRNEMYLLHSTVDGEIQTAQWKLFLLTDPNNNDNKLMHRVFEYFN